MAIHPENEGTLLGAVVAGISSWAAVETEVAELHPQSIDWDIMPAPLGGCTSKSMASRQNRQGAPRRRRRGARGYNSNGYVGTHSTDNKDRAAARGHIHHQREQGMMPIMESRSGGIQTLDLLFTTSSHITSLVLVVCCQPFYIHLTIQLVLRFTFVHHHTYSLRVNLRRRTLSL